MANVQNRPHIKLEEQFDVKNDKFIVNNDGDFATKEYVDEQISGAGYTAGNNITIENNVVSVTGIDPVALQDGIASSGHTIEFSMSDDGNYVLTSSLKDANGNVLSTHSVNLPQKQADWNQTTNTESDYIKNKPAIKAGQGASSIIEGIGSTASGAKSHAEGSITTASGNGSHAEGSNTTASGSTSHAEGAGTTASGSTSHAEGALTTASGDSSHAEGAGTTASGSTSHAEGYKTTANHKSQFVFGEYNGVDSSSALSIARGTYVEIVGNGTTTTNLSNARTLDWSGNENIAGMLRIGSSSSTGGCLLKIDGTSLKISFDDGTTWLTVSAS